MNALSKEQQVGRLAGSTVNRLTGKMANTSMRKSAKKNEKISEVQSRFPEKVEYLVSPEAALQAIREALMQIQGFREKDLHVIRDVIRPLIPDSGNHAIAAKFLDELSLSYKALINFIGYLTAGMTLLRLHTRIDRINHYYRLAVLPFLDLRLREKIDTLAAEKPLAWRLQKFVYERVLRSLGNIVDNLVSLIALGWVFCPGIGEPDKNTGFYNRFVFGTRSGFLDLGHFFNCAVIAYVYGTEAAKARAESVEISQRRVHDMRWLVWMHESSLFAPLVNLIWAYGMSADTIEDRSSDWFGIALGQKIREHKNNGKIIEFFMAQWPHLVKGEVLGAENESIFRKIYDVIKMAIPLLRYRPGSGGGFDIAKYMQEFFANYGGLDPNDEKAVSHSLLKETVDFYMNKYGHAEWHKFTSRSWEVVIPQKLWEQVARDKLTPDMTKINGGELPFKVQLDNGEKVPPYFREA